MFMRGAMKRSILKKSALALSAACAIAGGTLTLIPAASAATPPAYKVHKVGAYGGEPSMWVDSKGGLWSTYLPSDNNNPNIYHSTNHGATWQPVTTADKNSGDDCIVTDQLDNLYWCNLGGGQSIHPLEGDVYKSTDHGKTWVYGMGNLSNLAGVNVGGTSSNAFGVDRQWLAAYIRPGGTTDNALVAFFYHDFSVQSNVYVNISQDGGKTFGAPMDLMTSFDPAAPDTVAVEAASACNTIPTAVRIPTQGPHKGRIYTSWIAADPTSLVTGCDFTQFQAFHTLIVAWSDDEGKTWTPKIAYDGGFFHDASSPFASFAIDDLGNPYYAYVMNRNWDQTCTALPGVGAPQTANCEFDMYVTWSPDGGNTWKGPFKVNSDTGTHWFPSIAAGAPGQVDVGYLRTPYIIATDANGKQHPGGCFPLECGSDVQWDLYAGQSVNLSAATPTWATTKVTTKPMHAADICNLGIACPPLDSNRNLADFISQTIDEQGCAHINFADDLSDKQVSSADQVSGQCLARVSGAQVSTPSPSPTATPPLPNTAVAGAGGNPLHLVLLGAAILLATLGIPVRRRRKRSA